MEMRMPMDQFDHNARRKNKYKENEKILYVVKMQRKKAIQETHNGTN